MSDDWYFADGEEPVGPLTLQELQKKLRTLRDPGKVLVWHAGFSDWMRANDVSELRKQTLRAPPVPTSRPNKEADPKEEFHRRDDRPIQRGIAGWLILPTAGTFSAAF